MFSLPLNPGNECLKSSHILWYHSIGISNIIARNITLSLISLEMSVSKLGSVKDIIPEPYAKAFTNRFDYFNDIQACVVNSALQTDVSTQNIDVFYLILIHIQDNIVIAAPTGSGLENINIDIYPFLRFSSLL